MNDYEIRQLIFDLEKKFNQKISELQNEITFLKEAKEKKSSLKEYYLERYNKVAITIKEDRLFHIKEEVNELKDEQNRFIEQLDNASSKVENYQENQKSYEDLKSLLDQTYLALENCNFEYERKCNNLYKEVETLDDKYNEMVIKYVNATESFEEGEIFANELQLKMNQIIRYFNDEGYINATKTINLVEQLQVLTQENEKLVESYNDQIQLVANDMDAVDLEDPYLAMEDTKKILEDITEELTRKEQVEMSLVELLDKLISTHQEKIIDTIEHQELLDVNKADIASIVDPLVEELLEDLRVTDTKVNIKNNLLLRLGKITGRIGELEESVVKRSVLEKEYENYQNILDQVNENFKTMENYIEKSYQIIRSNQSYRYYFDEYVASNTKIKELMHLIEGAKEENNRLKEKRKGLVIDPYAKPKVIEIDEIIANNDHKITTSLQDINYIRDDLKYRGASNERLYKVIKDKELAEEKLPIIASKKEELIKELTKRYEELKTYDAMVDEYNELLEEAELINEQLQANND